MMAGKEPPKRRVTILGLMTLVLICGVGTAALAASTDMWASIVVSAVLLILTTSILLKVYGRRPFWLGFAVFGWAYLVGSLIPSVEARLLTRSGLVWLDANAMNRQMMPTILFTPDGRTLLERGASEVRIWDPSTGKPISPTGTFSNFLRIGHSVFALFAGLLGGFMATWLEGRSARRTSGITGEDS